MEQEMTIQYTHEAYRSIREDLAPSVMARFMDKAQDYRDAFAYLGARGQFSDMNRKFQKLKHAIWDGRPLVGEQPAEIIEDMIGHCYLLLYILEQEKHDAAYAKTGGIQS